MSWIAGLAGKAESLLNNIDQSAAGAIQIPTNAVAKIDDPNDLLRNPTIPRDVQPRELIPKQSVTVKKPEITESTETLHSTETKINKAKEFTKKKKTDKESELLDFLNSDSKLPSTKSKVSNEVLRNSPRALRSLGSASNLQKKESVHPPDYQISRKLSSDSSKRESPNNELASTCSDPDSTPVQVGSSTASESEFEMVAASDAEESSEPRQKMELQMLREEIIALNREMKEMSAKNNRIKTELTKRNNALKVRLDDTEKELNVKNSQMSAMQMELQLALNEVHLTQNKIDSLRTEKDRILEDHNAGSGMHVQAMEELQKRLREAEDQLVHEKKNSQTTHQEFMVSRDEFMDNIQKLSDSLKQAQADCLQEKKRVNEAMTEMNFAKTSLSLTQQELNDYKTKATRILQSKEKIIASLKDGSSTSDATTSAVELEELRQDRDILKEELKSARNELMDQRNKFREMEADLQQDVSMMQEELNEVKQRYEESEQMRQDAEAQINKLSMEVRSLNESLAQSRSNYNDKLHNSQITIDNLSNQLMMTSVHTREESELEARLKQLTESLITKQTSVETLSSEKNSLLLQLERMQVQVKRLSEQSVAQTQITMDVSSERPSHDNSSVVGQFRNAAGAVDKFSVRLGVFLRRYPIARTFVIIYMGLLHLWVMVVLLTYSPEIHGPGHHFDIKETEQADVHGLPNE